MPVHWMYDLRQLQSDYGIITGYTKPKDKFVGSILNLSNTGGGGRGSDKVMLIFSTIYSILILLYRLHINIITFLTLIGRYCWKCYSTWKETILDERW
jgi:hypothetical protein